MEEMIGLGWILDRIIDCKIKPWEWNRGPEYIADDLDNDKYVSEEELEIPLPFGIYLILKFDWSASTWHSEGDGWNSEIIYDSSLDIENVSYWDETKEDWVDLDHKTELKAVEAIKTLACA
jgi:hypothetical protein